MISPAAYRRLTDLRQRATELCNKLNSQTLSLETSENALNEYSWDVGKLSLMLSEIRRLESIERDHEWTKDDIVRRD
jgi:hypothetical protein